MTIESIITTTDAAITNTKTASMASEFVLFKRKTKISELFIYIIFKIIIRKTVISSISSVHYQL